MRWQAIRLWAAIFALLVLSILGFRGVLQEWRYADNLGRQFSTYLQILYSLLGLAGALAILLRQRWSRAALYAWAAALVLTGATAPVIWVETGWWPGVFAAAITALTAGAVIWLAPLPAAGAAFNRWRWVAAGGYAAAGFLVLYLLVNYEPLAVHGKELWDFCYHTPGGLTRVQLEEMVTQRGFAAVPGTDAKGQYLRIQDARSGGHYYCEARFKYGKIDSMNYTARARD